MSQEIRNGFVVVFKKRAPPKEKSKLMERILMNSYVDKIEGSLMLKEKRKHGKKTRKK